MEKCASIGPCSQAVGEGYSACVSGHGDVDPEPGEGSTVDVRDGPHQTVAMISGIRAAADTSLDIAVKSIVSVRDMDDDAINRAPEEYRDGPCRARSGRVEALPVDTGVQIKRIATKDR